MNTSPLLRRLNPLRLIILGTVLWAPPLAWSIETVNVTLPGDTVLQIDNSVSFSVEVRGTTETVDTDYPYNLYVTGADIYGNAIFIQVAQGTLRVRGPRTVLPPGATTPVNEPATTDRFQGEWIVPRDGTLHNSGITAGYRMIAAIYAPGTPLPSTPGTLIAALALPPQVSGDLTIEVLPDIAIPPVRSISKQRATATAALGAGGSVALTVTNPGAGYDPNFPPAVTVGAPPPGGTAAQYLAIVEAETGSITGFTAVNPGAGYLAAPTVTIANAPSNMTQRTGGVLYKAGTYYGGDILRFRTTILNRATVPEAGNRQSRPLRTNRADRHRLNVVLTTDPRYDEDTAPPDEEAGEGTEPEPTTTTPDDYLIAFHDILGDMAGAPVGEFSTIRAVNVYGTPPAVPAYGINTGGTTATATAAPPAVGGVLTTADLTVTAPGTRYDPANPPAVTITGGGGFGATARAIVGGGGTVTGLAIVNGGAGYTAAPTVTIAPPLAGARNYTPTPDNGFLDIGEQVEIDYEVLMPKSFAGIYYVAARADAFDNENFLEVNPLDRKTWVSAAAARITLLSGPDESTSILSQVTAPDGTGLLQSNGASDRSAVDGSGRYAAFQSLASNLSTGQAEAAAESTGGTPLLAEPAGSNTVQQIYRRDLATREVLLASVSSGGGAANGKCQNPAINRAPDNLAVDGRFIAFESEANNLVVNDINGSSDIFIRSSSVGFRTSRASINQDGVQGNAGSYRPGLSGNGRFVVFESTATNLDLVNPVPAVSNLGSQIYVHDRDVSNSGVYDTAGNVRTYLVSLANDGSTRATATVAGGQIINGQVSAVTVAAGGVGYRAAYPPAVVIAPPPAGPAAVQATAQAVVNGAGQVTSVRILNPGAGYNPAAPPAVVIAPRAVPAGDATGNNGWNNQPRISDDGKYVTWVSYSSNLPRTPGGVAIGNAGWRGVVYRIRLQDGLPLTDTIEAVSVNASTGQLANLLAYEPSINADGSVIAFTSWASNLITGDNNGVSDVFARDYRPGINATRRISDSQPRLAIGSIFFQSGRLRGLAPNNNPAAGDTITLNDGTNPAVNFVFGPAVAPGVSVPIGATASATRNNLARAINNAFRAGQLDIIAGNLPSDRLRSVNTGSNETILDAGDLLEFAEPTSNTPANSDPFYAVGSNPPGQALLPGLLLLHTDPNAAAPNQPIAVLSGGTPPPFATDGVTTVYTMASGYTLSVTGMRLGGREAELDSGELDGVPLGSDQPSVDRSGDTVAFRSTMQTMDVFDRTFTDTNGIFRGELRRMLVNFAGNIYVAERDPATGVTAKTTRASVSRFGYRTNRLLGRPSSAASHAPSVSGNGRYVTFSSDSDNRAGLIFGPTNLLPFDTNELRDTFIHDRLIATDLPPVIENRRPQAVLTEPLWLSGNTIGVGSVVTAAVLATDADQTLNTENVRFLIDGQEFEATGRYGNYFTFSYTALQETSSSVIQVRVIDSSGASNDTAFSQEVRFKVGPSTVGPTAVTAGSPVFIADPVANPSGIPTVGFPVTLSARVTIPFVNFGTDALGNRIQVLNVVRFYANGVLVSEATVPDGTTGALVNTTWYPQSSGAVEITAVASVRVGGSFMTLSSNTLPAFLVTQSASDLIPGSPEAVAVQLFQTVMSRAPGAAEQTFYTNAFTSGTMTPAQMVAQLITTQEYSNLQNRIFNFYYRLGTAPLVYTYPAVLGAARSNTAPLPATEVDATVTNPPSPYGATQGQASAAQQIVSSAGFNAASPGTSSLSNQSFVTWFRSRMALFGGSNHGWNDTQVYQTLMPGSSAPQGAGVAFMTAYYTAKNNGSAYGPTSAYQFQLYASSLQWLFTGEWSAPATLQVTTQAALDTFITNLLNRSEGQSTWAWINSFTTLTAAQRTAQAAPAGDGINNLLKYAFNLSPLVAGGQMPAGGTAGTPRGDLVTVNGLNYLQLTYVRRVNTPSVTYHPEFNWQLNAGSWTRTSASNPETVTPIGTDGLWERVTVRDTVPNSMANARFGRVLVNASYWTPAQPNPAPDPSPNVP